ncbi:MAG TPA: serine/threonine-protein kinase [Kofleriaceae bacterium]|nr:serine/threonine-protein kinase [Kofleriaceae bacterium]
MPRCHAPPTDRGRRRGDGRDPLIGAWLDDRFLIEARIATGGFGAIYRARTRAGQPAAIKVLHPWLIDDAEIVARFRREGATLVRLHDPHTVRTLAIGDTGGLLYIAMELLAGETLQDRLNRTGALPWRTAVAIARAVCSSLAEAHALGVVHRDLKPANIYLARHLEARGELVKVLDFGISRIERGSAIDDGRDLTYVGHLIGTCDYMCPEQIVGDPCRAASDIYSLGVVLHEMLTGRRPFAEARGPAATLAAMLTQTPVAPSEHVAAPPALDSIVLRCLEREPEDRFAGIAPLAAALDEVLASFAPSDAWREEPTAPFAACGLQPARIDDRASLHTTLPGVMAPPELRRRNVPTAPRAPVAPRPPAPVVPAGGQLAPDARTWIPAPAILVPQPAEPLASGSGPQLPARSRGALWIVLALALVCTAALAITALG